MGRRAMTVRGKVKVERMMKQKKNISALQKAFKLISSFLSGGKVFKDVIHVLVGTASVPQVTSFNVIQ